MTCRSRNLRGLFLLGYNYQPSILDLDSRLRMYDNTFSLGLFASGAFAILAFLRYRRGRAAAVSVKHRLRSLCIGELKRARSVFQIHVALSPLQCAFCLRRSRRRAQIAICSLAS